MGYEGHMEWQKAHKIYSGDRREYGKRTLDSHRAMVKDERASKVPLLFKDTPQF